MTPGEWDRVCRLARIACRKFRGSDNEDCQAVARAAIWRAGLDHTDLHLILVGRRRALDWWRTWTGAQRTVQAERVSLDALAHDPAAVDPVDVVLEHGWTGRDELIARGLELGWTKAEVAASLGVDPAIVSRRLAAMRRT